MFVCCFTLFKCVLSKFNIPLYKHTMSNFLILEYLETRWAAQTERKQRAAARKWVGRVILHAVQLLPLKVATGEVAKAWPPAAAWGCSLLNLCPLIELQWVSGGVGRPARAQTKSYSNWLATILPVDGMPQSMDMLHGQSWSKTNDWLWFGDEILNPSATESALKFIWIGCENVGRVGLKCQWWPNRWFAGLCFSALLYLPHEQRHYTTVVTLSSVHLKRIWKGGAKNSKRPKLGLLCESTAKEFHIYLWRQIGVSETKSRKK